MKGKLIKVDTGWILMVDNKIYASHNDILSPKNCQAIERGYDLDELADIESDKALEIYPEHSKSLNQDEVDRIRTIVKGQTYIGFKKGFQKALELMGDKKFSEEDVVNIAEYVRVASQSSPSVRTKDLFNEYQSLQQTEWDVEIILNDIAVIEEKNAQGEITYSNHHISAFYKLDADGCLILKRVI